MSGEAAENLDDSSEELEEGTEEGGSAEVVELSLHDTLSAAFDESETTDAKEGEAEAGTEAKGTEGEKDAKQEEGSSDETQGEASEKGPEGENTEAKPAASERPRAPNSWKAGVREAWSSLPAEVQDEVVRREREHDTLMQENAQNRNAAQEYQKVIEPYINNIRAEGVSPAVAIDNLLQTASSLQMGSALTKAQTITRLIGAYGVDIQTLSDVLTNSYQPTEQDKVQQEVQRQMQPYQQQHNQQNQLTQQQEQQQVATVRAETDAWSETAEFVTDVGPQMADLLEMAGRRGQTLTLDQAYDQACKLHPEVSKVLQQRADQTAAAARMKTNKSKRRAGSSVTGAGVGNGSNSVPTSLRGALEQAYDDSLNGGN